MAAPLRFGGMHVIREKCEKRRGKEESGVMEDLKGWQDVYWSL
jgi:hypothetical protein